MDHARFDHYLSRIGLTRAALHAPSAVETLAALVRAHRLAIPFENLAIQQGRGISLADEDVFAKLVTARRGGYCFEQNSLLSRALGVLGIAHRLLLGRVWLNAPAGVTVPRTHLVLAAELEGALWLADTGFGGGYAPPLRIGDHGAVIGPDGVRYRLVPAQDAGEWLLERSADGATWHAQYSFDMARVVQADIECANHWTSTRAATRFTTLHIASRVTPSGLITLLDRSLTTLAHGETAHRPVETPAEWHSLLEQELTLPLTLAEVQALPLFS